MTGVRVATQSLSSPTPRGTHEGPFRWFSLFSHTVEKVRLKNLCVGWTRLSLENGGPSAICNKVDGPGGPGAQREGSEQKGKHGVLTSLPDLKTQTSQRPSVGGGSGAGGTRGHGLKGHKTPSAPCVCFCLCLGLSVPLSLSLCLSHTRALPLSHAPPQPGTLLPTPGPWSLSLPWGRWDVSASMWDGRLSGSRPP